MNFDYLEAFMYVVRFKSFHKAADALYLSQPSITARIKGLERELETQLFTRQGRGVTLTAKGKEFIPFAEQMIRTYQQSKQKLQTKTDERKFTFGANIITAQYVLPHFLRYFQEMQPDLEYDVVCGGNESMMEAVSRNEIDIAFVRQQGKELDDLIIRPFLDNSILLVVHPDHHFSSTLQYTAHKIAREPLVFFECGAFNWNLVHKIFEAHNVKPTIRHRVGNMEVAKSLIVNRAGIGFLPKLAVKKELESGELRSIDVSHLMNFNQQIEGVQSVGNPLSLPIERSLLESVKLFEQQSSLISAH
ncbi:LysR family transcriptional regulator [Alkalicoccobacillus murimartini]|uniref:DNA-binding transcriptional LysR family regulator n=1 Tax=Alkalicoccobacillus murimartini TaxID=171685 RepID=A0ABT9YG08_9BACI|nr:LysR family transcriptional regulator [Alkalicoccobacillus murimartini]MDQ0206533.1 DNA-binding transcriptional LysR family regulator [Alkalicoccobacillus murimartini]